VIIIPVAGRNPAGPGLCLPSRLAAGQSNVQRRPAVDHPPCCRAGAGPATRTLSGRRRGLPLPRPSRPGGAGVTAGVRLGGRSRQGPAGILGLLTRTAGVPVESSAAGPGDRDSGRPSRGGSAPRAGRRLAAPAIWTRILGTPISSVGRTISTVIFDIVHIRYRVHIDIEDFYNRYRVSISKVYDIEGHISRYRRSRKDISISKFRIFRYRLNKFRYRYMISYTISNAF
jgi:hypothetical protein